MDIENEVAPLEPWPQKGDDPFASAPDWQHNACINWDSNEPWLPIADGFRMAADIVVESIIARPRSQDFLVYPVMTNYRHFIELSLKGLIRDARDLLGDPSLIPNHHNLEHLWSELRPLLEEAVSGGTDDMDNVEQTLKRFAWFDRTSQGSRYPVDKQGQPPLPDTLSLVNLRLVKDVIAGLDNFFWACDAEMAARSFYGP